MNFERGDFSQFYIDAKVFHQVAAFNRSIHGSGAATCCRNCIAIIYHIAMQYILIKFILL